eukprot:jgi/Mesen1/9963/ME000072S09383
MCLECKYDPLEGVIQRLGCVHVGYRLHVSSVRCELADIKLQSLNGALEEVLFGPAALDGPGADENMYTAVCAGGTYVIVGVVHQSVYDRGRPALNGFEVSGFGVVLNVVQ